MEKRLNPQLLRTAYSHGYFPMYHEASDEILWYNPDPRAVIPLDGFHSSRSLRRSLRTRGYRVTFDEAFLEVMKECAKRTEGSWINDEFLEAYEQLHRDGNAHSVEVWKDSRLVGGVYGVTLGAGFFAESKFHRATDASKIALFHLVERLRLNGFRLLEVQFLTPHLKSLGAIEIPGSDYAAQLRQALRLRPSF